MSVSDRTPREELCKRIEFGKRFRKAYNRKGMSMDRKEFCSLCGISEATLSRWLGGLAMPLDDGTIRRAAEVLRVAPEYLKGTQARMLPSKPPESGLLDFSPPPEAHGIHVELGAKDLGRLFTIAAALNCGRAELAARILQEGLAQRWETLKPFIVKPGGEPCAAEGVSK